MQSQNLSCDQCGATFSRPPSAHQPHNFCKRACYNAYYKANYGGLRSPLFRGGKRAHNAGYITLRLTFDDQLLEMANGRREVLEHRYVMAKHLGRALQGSEVVHHRNHDRTDNRLENLQLIQGHSAHGKLHAADIVRRLCSCGRKHYARGMCINCYMRWFNAKTPGIPMSQRKRDAAGQFAPHS